MRASATPGSSTPIPRSSGCATSSRARSTTSILTPCSISGRASPRSRRGSAGTRISADCRPSSVSSSTRRGDCRSPTSMRTFASKRRANRTLAVYLAGEDALAAECAPGETGEIAVRLGRAFVRLAGAGEGSPRRMRALVARQGRRRVRRGGSRSEAAHAFAAARVARRPPRRARTAAPASLSAPRRRSARSRPADFWR